MPAFASGTRAVRVHRSRHHDHLRWRTYDVGFRVDCFRLTAACGDERWRVLKIIRISDEQPAVGVGGPVPRGESRSHAGIDPREPTPIPCDASEPIENLSDS